MDSGASEQMKKALLGGQMKELVDPYLLFSFAGKEVSAKYSLLLKDRFGKNRLKLDRHM